MVVKILYAHNYKNNGMNWLLVVENEGKYKYTETRKFTTKPKGKLLRKNKSDMIKQVQFSKCWGEI